VGGLGPGPPLNPALLHTYYSSIGTRMPEISDCSFEWGLRTLNFGEGEAVGCMVPFEIVFVSFCP